ncbi:MAG: hypothetical protein FJ215_10525 [Ignavibacteria bacterium]|nr:hypothetical protein [Ignavibacteria bacterium]
MKKNSTKPLYISTRKTWREWLRKNHNRKAEIWLVYYKKHTGKPRIPYDDAVEEAICFGWIDGMIKRVDDETFIQRFTPRSSTSKWSRHNIRRAEKMIAARKMTRTGMAAYQLLLDDPKSRMADQNPAFENAVHPDFTKAMKDHNRARTNFAEFPPSYQRLCYGWINAAKRDKTRQKRIAQIVRLAARGEKIGMV